MTKLKINIEFINDFEIYKNRYKNGDKIPLEDIKEFNMYNYTSFWKFNEKFDMITIHIYLVKNKLYKIKLLLLVYLFYILLYYHINWTKYDKLNKVIKKLKIIESI